MSIKVAVTKQKKNITTFPCIGITGEGLTELIVLFKSHNEGTVLQSNSYEIGYTSTTWTIGIFEPYEGTVRLSNKQETY